MCLLGMFSCHPRCPCGQDAILGTTISDGTNSYKVTKVTWTSDFLIFTVDVVFINVHVIDPWSCDMTIDNDSSYPAIERNSAPFNLEKTNQENEVQIGEDRRLTVTGTYFFYFDQILEDVAVFVDNEYSSMSLFLFITESGTQIASYFHIQNEEVTYDVD